MVTGSPQYVLLSVGKPFGFEGVEGVEGLASVRALEDAEPRADCRVSGPVPVRWSVSESSAEAMETVEAGESPVCEGRSLRPPTLELWLAALQASHVGCRVARNGDGGGAGVGLALSQNVVESMGRSLRPLELMLVGDGERLLREAALLVLVVHDIAKLAPSSSS